MIKLVACLGHWAGGGSREDCRKDTFMIECFRLRNRHNEIGQERPTFGVHTQSGGICIPGSIGSRPLVTGDGRKRSSGSPTSTPSGLIFSHNP